MYTHDEMETAEQLRPEWGPAATGFPSYETMCGGTLFHWSPVRPTSHMKPFCVTYCTVQPKLQPKLHCTLCDAISALNSRGQYGWNPILWSVMVIVYHDSNC